MRQLVLELRARGRRALVGTSANLTRQPTIVDPAEVEVVFADRVPLMLLDSVDRVSQERRRSASIVDLTGPIPRLVREGSVPAEELRVVMRRLRFRDLTVGSDVKRV
ncbi:MAG TPA: Sua5/YciO/YrdC/YwlC family protein [Actinomycetota bacterium]|nr:Sua5/YciO/YrdC/YwlC family protein [Actinomycetota bacterium]